MKTFLRWLVRLLFGYRADNEGVLKTPGPVLLIPNHVSWLDWIFVGVCLDDDWKFVVSSRTAGTSWLHRKLMLNRRTFPIDTLSPYSAKHMAEYLQKGGRLVLFAEGRLSRTGTLMKLFEGTGFLLHKTSARHHLPFARRASRAVFAEPGREEMVPARLGAFQQSAHAAENRARLHQPGSHPSDGVVARRNAASAI